MPAKVKCIVDSARDDDKSARASKGRRIGIKDVKEYYADFFNLPRVERVKILEKRPVNIDLAIADATTRQRWKPAYRELQDALDILDALTKRRMSKIIDAIPNDHVIATAKRVEGAKTFLIKLSEKLTPNKKVEKVPPADNAACLAKLLTEARKNGIKKYGSTNQTQVVETIWPDLNLAQIELLRSGKYGPEIKAATERLILAQNPHS